MATYHSHYGAQLSAAGWGRSHQYGRWCVVCFKILLHDKAAHGMPDEDGRVWERADDLTKIGDVVGNRTQPQRLAQRAVTVTAQAGRQDAKSPVDEEGNEIFLPTPGGMPSSVHENDRVPTFLSGLSGVKQFEHLSPLFSSLRTVVMEGIRHTRAQAHSARNTDTSGFAASRRATTDLDVPAPRKTTSYRCSTTPAITTS
jgi:hypothetical protein